jgi:hypothetical protein
VCIGVASPRAFGQGLSEFSVLNWGADSTISPVDGIMGNGIDLLYAVTAHFDIVAMLREIAR